MDKLMAALSKAQSLYKPLLQSQEDIMPTVQRSLSENGLSIYQYCKIVDGESVVCSVLAHESGQYIESISIKNKEYPLSLLGLSVDKVSANMPQDLRKLVTITTEQWEDIMRDLDGDPGLAKEIMREHDITTFKDLPKADFYRVKDGIKDIKDKQRRYERGELR